jgi:hypothetical protein
MFRNRLPAAFLVVIAISYTSVSPIILEEESVIRVSAESTRHCINIVQPTDGSTSSTSHLVVPFFIRFFLKSHLLFHTWGWII